MNQLALFGNEEARHQKWLCCVADLILPSPPRRTFLEEHLPVDHVRIELSIERANYLASVVPVQLERFMSNSKNRWCDSWQGRKYTNH